MSYHHLSMFERARIQTLQTLGYSTRKIATQIGRHHSSIARELVRNVTKDAYLAEDAHQSYEKRRTNSKPHGKHNQTILDVIEEKLRLTWSPSKLRIRLLSEKSALKPFITGCIKVSFP